MSPSAPTRNHFPLQSDPPWLLAGIGALSLGALGAFVGIFAAIGLTPSLGALPGMTLAVFGGSGLAVWGRRKGATLFLDVTPGRLDLRDPGQRSELLDLAAPWAAVLLRDAGQRRRALVLSQRGEPVVVMEPAPQGEGGGATAEAVWGARVADARLSDLAISPASAGVFALTEGQRLDGLLSRLEPALDAGAPWLVQSTPAGSLVVTRDELRLGERSWPRESARAVQYSVQVQGGFVAGLGIANDDGPLLMFACEEVTPPVGAARTEATPDAYVPPATYEVLRALVRS